MKTQLVGVTEIAGRAGVTSRRVQQWRDKKPDFPEPVVNLAAGPIWYWPDVQDWLDKPRPPGRPNR